MPILTRTPGSQVGLYRPIMVSKGPLGPLGFKCSHNGPTTRPSVERTAEKALLLSDRVQLSSAKTRVEGIQCGSVGVEGFHL